MVYFFSYCKFNDHEMSIPFCCEDWDTSQMETWRDRARRAMKTAGITQDKLAELLEMTQGGVQHWLAGTRQPSIDDINRIALALQVPPAWLTHGLEADDMLDGLAEPARSTLRRLIRMERQHLSPSSLWTAINATADLSLGADSHPRETDEQEHARITSLIDSSE